MQFPRALTSYLPVTASLFQSRTDWSWCRQATVGGASGGTRGRRRSRHRQEMEDNWLREERTKPKRESENVEKWKTAKTIQSAMTFTLCCNPLHRTPSQGSARPWLVGHKREKRLFFFLFSFLWISRACLQDTTYPSERAFQARHLKWCIRNVTSL